MIIVDCEQGSPEWHKVRAGIPTASEFNKIVTSRGEPSKQADAYMRMLLAEWLNGSCFEGYESYDMRRGKEIEPEARSFYELQRDLDIQQAGFCYGDDRKLFGCSPDGLVGDDGMVQFKCPKPSTHIEYMMRATAPTDYLVQMQGEMLVTGRKWNDFVSYVPGLPFVLMRVERDNGLIMTIRSRLERFIEKILTAREELKELGYAPPRREEDGSD